MLLEQVKSDLLQARKNKESIKASLLSSVVGELQRGSGKDVTDDQVIKQMKKMLVNAEENLKQFPDHTESQTEVQILTAYVPAVMSEADLRALIQSFKAEGMNNIGQIMKALQTQYTGSYDGKMASALVKEALA